MPTIVRSVKSYVAMECDPLMYSAFHTGYRGSCNCGLWPAEEDNRCIISYQPFVHQPCQLSEWFLWANVCGGMQGIKTGFPTL